MSERRPRSSARARLAPSLNGGLLLALLCVLLIAGGSSRADALGQVVVRAASALVLIAGLLLGERTGARSLAPIAILLAAALGLALIQLIPLPPQLWLALPGHAVLAEAAAASGQPQPWRPWSMVPGATVNAAASLIVPVATLVLLAGLRADEWRRLPGVLLCLIMASTVVGLLQLSGTGVDNPFINDDPGLVSGTLANHNHFALLVAFGCAIVPVWAFPGSGAPGWRVAVGTGLVALFMLALLASGSRAGTAVGGLALIAGAAMARRRVVHALGRYPRWVMPAVIVGAVVLVAALVFVSVSNDRAIAINRAITVDPWVDMRRRGLPTVLAMLRDYFPFGAGLGSFDPIFRLHEPFALLKPTYFNHAHDDLIEVGLDAGLFGFALLTTAIAWWLVASIRAWRGASPTADDGLPRLGSVLLLLVLLASVVDYPARTPLMMAVMVVAAGWLCQRDAAAEPQAGAAALPPLG